MQIHKLEDELQISIFDRAKSPIAPTKEGEMILKQADIIIKEHKKLYDIVNESRNEVAGEFILGIIPTLFPYVLPLFIKAVQNEYPKLKLHVKEMKTEEIIEALKDDSIDAGILVTPLHDKNIKERALFNEPFYLFANNKHPLSKKSKVKQEDVIIDDLWLLNKGHCFRDQVLNICTEKNKDRPNPIDIETGSFETLKSMVQKMGGITLIPHMDLGSMTATQKKMVRPFSRPVPIREVALVHNANSTRQHILDRFEELMLSKVPQELLDLKQKDFEVIEIY
jgi:LysR family hydrogen peroxide-inducible transcriptional activator